MVSKKCLKCIDIYTIFFTKCTLTFFVYQIGPHINVQGIQKYEELSLLFFDGSFSYGPPVGPEMNETYLKTKKDKRKTNELLGSRASKEDLLASSQKTKVKPISAVGSSRSTPAPQPPNKTTAR